MKTCRLLGIQLLLIVSVFSVSASAASVKDYLDHPLIKDMKLSPSGQYLAVQMFSEGEGHWLRFLDRETFEVLGGLAFPGGREVGEFYWANDERVVLKVYDVSGSVEAPRFYGDLFALNYDGSKKEAIFGFRTGGQQTGSLIRGKKASLAWGDIIDPLPDDKSHILISSTPWTEKLDGKSTAVLLDVYTGTERRKFKTSKHPFGSFITDRSGQVRMVKSYKEDRTPLIEVYPNSDTGWIDIDNIKMDDSFTPFAVSYDLDSAYVFDHGDDDKLGLYTLSFDDLTLSKVYAHDRVNVTMSKMTVDGTGVYGMQVDDGYPSYLLFSSDYEEAKIFKRLTQTFPGRIVDILSRTADGKTWIVKTESDIDPGSFYLFDAENNKIGLLFNARPALEAEEMSPMVPIEFESFDGLSVSGYFTQASALKEDDVAPMVVLVHGGPRTRDYWGFNPEVQLLASRGFSVLQINYRGSSGYGKAFMAAGDRHWGDHVQQDIIAGTRWAIEQGKAKSGNICIMGASFGAYSALQSSVLEPDLYACAIGNAGVYDLQLMHKKGDIYSRYIGDKYLEQVIGIDDEELAKFSPVNHVAKIKAPLLIAHGKKDERAPFEHAEALTKALDKHNKPYELFVKRREAHGFYDVDNNVEFYEKALKFLGKHLQ